MASTPTEDGDLTATDVLYLRAALELAARGRYSTSPNPRVGCVLVRRGQILGRGWHRRAGGPHAEVAALDDARQNGHSVRGATAYVSLEPCSFYGRTPPCADMLVDVGIRRVVGASRDRHPKVAGFGYERLRSAGVLVTEAELDEALQLNRGYLQRHQRGRPWVTLKVAASLDGAVALANGESQWITGEAARADVQRLRAQSCAVLTGVGTVLADDPQLNVRDPAFAVDGVLRQPLRIVLDSQLRTPSEARLFNADGAGAVLLVHGTRAAPDAWAGTAETLACGDEQVDLAALVAKLAARELNEVLVEAGPRVIGAFLQAGLWDELVLYLAPKVLGSASRQLAEFGLTRLDDAVGGGFSEVTRLGEDLRLTLRNTRSEAVGC